MKKYIALLLFFCAGAALAAEPLLLINPFRETFVDFPSSALKKAPVITVFMPEKAVPLQGRYPTVYLLGAGPKDAEAAQTLISSSSQKALLVGIKLAEEDQADASAAETFIARELVPYISLNYGAVDAPDFRAVAVQRPEDSVLAAGLLARPNLFGRGMVLNGGETVPFLRFGTQSPRVLVAGSRAGVLAWQEKLEQAKLVLGTGFISRIGQEQTLFNTLDLDYLFAPQEKAAVSEVFGTVYPHALSLKGKAQSFLSVRAVLAGGYESDYIPLSLRMSPPYLNWDAVAGTLTPIAGALPGNVKISVSVDKTAFSDKIRLKK